MCKDYAAGLDIISQMITPEASEYLQKEHDEDEENQLYHSPVMVRNDHSHREHPGRAR